MPAFIKLLYLVTLLTVFITDGTVQVQSQSSQSRLQETPQPSAAMPSVEIKAWRTEQAPVIDGNVVEDPAYAVAEPATNFRQNTPDEGQPASERTEVRIVYTDDTIYFGVICYTQDPGTIVVADSRRDSSLRETDSFQIILDTYLDHQNGFIFGTNPAGVEYDGQVTNEGSGSGRMGGGGTVGRSSGSQQQGGSGGGFNLNWDGVWQVNAKVSDIGWTAEFAIPFRTLRYPGADAQTWGINFQRNIEHRNERSFWAPLPRQFTLNRLSLAGLLQDIEVPSQRNLKITPYVLGDVVARQDNSETVSTGEIGVDLKYSVTPSMTLDLTYNTDFAQVEVDEQQINLDRFNLFFPEKRPFFLENAGLFSVGRPGQVEMFFSRRIGIGDGGEQVPIVGGGRLSGKIGSDTNIGFLNMQTESISEGLSQNYTVARIRQDLPSRSNIGAMFVNRQGTGSQAGSGNYNRTFAVDGRMGIGQPGTINGFAAETQTPGEDNIDAHSMGLGGTYEIENVRLSLSYTEVGPNFNPEVGFYRRRGYRRMDGMIFSFFRPDNFLGIHELRPHISHYSIFNYETGIQETQYTHIDNHWEWENGSEIHTGLNLTKEGLFQPFEIFPGVSVPIGSYAHKEARLTANTNRGAPVSFSLASTIGGFFGGDRVQLSPSVSFRRGEAFTTQLRWDRNDISLPGGDFVTNLGSFRISYSFTTRLFLQALLQYNDRADLWSSNIRFGLLSDANTGLFIVYNDIQGLGSLDPHIDVEEAAFGRTLTLKFSYLFDLLN